MDGWIQYCSAGKRRHTCDQASRRNGRCRQRALRQPACRFPALLFALYASTSRVQSKAAADVKGLPIFGKTHTLVSLEGCREGTRENTLSRQPFCIHINIQSETLILLSANKLHAE